MGQLKSKVIFLRGLCCLHEIVETGSISKVAEENGYQQPNLSRMMKELEATFGSKLFEKSSSGIVLTSFGKTLMAYVYQIDEIFNQIYYNFCKFKKEMSNVHIWIEDGFGNGYTVHCLDYFAKNYPKIRVDIISSGVPSNTLNGIDIAFVHERNPMRLLGTKLFEHSFMTHFWASKAYIIKHGYPKDMQDLLQNHQICIRKESLLWDEVRSFLPEAKHLFAVVDNTSLLIALIQDGVGIGLMPDWMGRDNPDLVSLRPIGFEMKHTVYGVANKNMVASPSSQTILDSVLKTFEERIEKGLHNLENRIE